MPTLKADYDCAPYPDGSNLLTKKDLPVRYNPAIVTTAMGFVRDDKNLMA